MRQNDGGRRASPPPRLRLVVSTGQPRVATPETGAAAADPFGGHPADDAVAQDAVALHPLTTRDAPILPGRGAPGGAPDVWEELDAAAAWVAAEWAPDGRGAAGREAAGREEVRQALRVLCVALRARASAAGAGWAEAAPALRLADVPWRVPVDELAARLRRRLVTVAADAGSAAGGAGAPSVLALAAALDGVEQAARADGARAVVEQLGGVHALELLVEVAHDMRSPLGSILFLVERVRASGALDAAADRQLALVHGAAFGLSTVVSDVMELARGGDRLARAAEAPFAVSTVLDEVQAILAPLAEEKGLVLDVAGAPPGLRTGRAAAVQRVLLNLATNALKFTPRGRVTVRAVAAGAERVRFEVADTGPGIPTAVQAQLFQTFRDRAGASTPVFSSAGLGLAISQRLVAALGGELEVRSAAGEGTRLAFEVALPPAAG